MKKYTTRRGDDIINELDLRMLEGFGLNFFLIMNPIIKISGTHFSLGKGKDFMAFIIDTDIDVIQDKIHDDMYDSEEIYDYIEFGSTVEQAIHNLIIRINDENSNDYEGKESNKGIDEKKNNS